MNLILFGAPGAGKGTQTGSLIEAYHIPAIATGDMLREQRRAGSALGEQVKGYMDRGELVPDALMIDIIKTRLKKPDAKNGFILDGFPRTVGQAEALDAMLDQLGRRVDAVIYLRVSEPGLVRPFRTPLYPVVPILGAIMCVVLLMSLMSTPATRNFFLTYLAVGILVYFVYGIRASKLGRGIVVTGHEPEPFVDLPRKGDV